MGNDSYIPVYGLVMTSLPHF